MDVMPTLVEHGMLLASARGPIPNVAEIVAGEPIKGSWWGHPAGHDIFGVLNDLAASPDVVRLRLVRGKVTLVHRRLWPALVRLESRFGPPRSPPLTRGTPRPGATGQRLRRSPTGCRPR
jgi:hypothetical protein